MACHASASRGRSVEIRLSGPDHFGTTVSQLGKDALPDSLSWRN